MNSVEAPLIVAQGLSGKVGELQKKKSEGEKKQSQQQQQQHSDDDDGSWDAITGSGSSAIPGGTHVGKHFV
jgi:hypothetical protein